MRPPCLVIVIYLAFNVCAVLSRILMLGFDMFFEAWSFDHYRTRNILRTFRFFAMPHNFYGLSSPNLSIRKMLLKPISLLICQCPLYSIFTAHNNILRGILSSLPITSHPAASMALSLSLSMFDWWQPIVEDWAASSWDFLEMEARSRFFCERPVSPSTIHVRCRLPNKVKASWIIPSWISGRLRGSHINFPLLVC